MENKGAAPRPVWREAAEVSCAPRPECRLGCGHSREARPERLGAGKCFGLRSGRQPRDLHGCQVTSLEERGRGTDRGCSASVGRGTSSFILPAELSECQGKLQELHRLLQSLESLHRIPSAPVIPTHQASVTTERPKKGKRTSRMWCTQSFAKDDTIGRVGRLHGSVPNLSRYLESRDPSGPRGLPPPDYAHLQRSFWALAQKGL